LNGTDKWPSEAAAMCYSGAGDPFLNLLNNKRDLDVKSVVLVGTPLKGERSIENPNLKTIVTIYGENDNIFSLNQYLRKDFSASTGKLFTNNPDPINEIVIKLKDMGHTDYFYDPLDTSANADIRKKASEFIARATAVAKDKDELNRFLLRTNGVTKDLSTGKFEVDLERVSYNDL
jgi:hypothetical protein